MSTTYRLKVFSASNELLASFVQTSEGTQITSGRGSRRLMETFENWIKDGLEEFLLGEDGDRERRVTMQDSPDFLPNLAAYLKRQTDFECQLRAEDVPGPDGKTHKIVDVCSAIHMALTGAGDPLSTQDLIWYLNWLEGKLGSWTPDTCKYDRIMKMLVMESLAEGKKLLTQQSSIRKSPLSRVERALAVRPWSRT